MVISVPSFVIFMVMFNFSVQNAEVIKERHSLVTTNGCGTSDPKLVTVAQGTMRGSTMYTGKSKPFCSFRGIPFSQPPIGDYRFKPPREPIPWSGVLDATKENPNCIMYVPIIGSFGNEDCLYLSVFTPKLKSNSSRLLDVMVWIYPGEYYAGTSSTHVTGPHYLIEKEVVVVFFNYRLGVLGFLSTGDDEAPGNYGMKDQVAALRWVKNNIVAFGGNASSITLFGISAGSSSSHLHMLSPMSKGLFHKVISMSGTAVNPWSRCPNPLKVAKKQARAVHCPTDTTYNLVRCLKQLDARKLVATLKYLFVWFIFPGAGYAPVVEKKTSRNPCPFMTEDPLDVMRKGNFERVPWLMGGASQEAAFALVPLINLIVTRHQANKLIARKYLPKFLMMDVSAPPDQVMKLADKMADFYMGPTHKFSVENRENVVSMFSDRLLIHGQHKAAQLHALVGNQTIYKYNTAYRGLMSSSGTTDIRNYGTSHGDEMAYIFKLGDGATRFLPLDKEVRDMFVTFLTNFAKYGNPTPGIPSGNYLVDEFQWLPVGQTSLDNMHLLYLNIGQVKYPRVPSKYLDEGLGPVTLQMATDLYKERMDFMDSLPLNENCLKDCYEQPTGKFQQVETVIETTRDVSEDWPAKFLSLLLLMLVPLTVVKLVQNVAKCLKLHKCCGPGNPKFTNVTNKTALEDPSFPNSKERGKTRVLILIPDYPTTDRKGRHIRNSAVTRGTENGLIEETKSEFFAR